MDDRKHETKRAINSIIRKKGRFPNLLEMCAALNFSERQATKYMQALEEDGYVQKQGSWYRFPAEPVVPGGRSLDFPPEVEFEFSTNIEVDFDKESEEKIIDEEKVYHSVESDEVKINTEDNAKMDLVGGKVKKGFFPGIKNTIKGLKVEKPDINIDFSADARPMVKAIKNIEKSTEDISVYGMPVYIIQVLMGVIGIGAAVISIYYTTIWLLEFLPWGFALLLSSIMVGFSISAFEASILFLSGQVTKNRISKISVVSGMILLWVIVSFFSIMSTVAGQYNKHIFNMRSNTEQVRSTHRMKWDILQEEKSEVKRRLADYRQQMIVFNNIISGINDVDSRIKNNGVWYESQYKLKQVNKKITELNEKMNAVRTQEKKLLDQSKKTGLLLNSGSKKKTKNFYSWLAGVTGVVQDKVQFGMSLFPAIFVDLIAPIGIAMSLFLRNKYKK